jgi:hypothetical protein
LWVGEVAVLARGCDVDVADTATFTGVEMPEHIHAAADASSPPVEGLIAERIGETLHRMARLDRVAVEMQLPMDLHQRHRPTVAGQHRQTARTQVPAPQAMGVGRFRWDRRRPAPVRHPKAVHDVGRFDPGPHHHPQLRQLGADRGESGRQGLLGVVQRGRFVEQRRAFTMQRGELVRTVRHPPIPLRILDATHVRLPNSPHIDSGKHLDQPTPPACARPNRNLPTGCATHPAHS